MPTEASRLRIILSEAEVTTVQRCDGMELRTCSRSSEEEHQEREVDHLQAGI